MRLSLLFSLASSLIVAGVLAAPAATESTDALYRRATYHNPVKSGGGADPFVLKHGDAYFMTYTTGGDIRVTRSNNIASWAQDDGVQVWSPNGQWGAIWAPELHFIQGAFYIYAAMTGPNGNNVDHRMYVFKGTSTTDPTQPFNFVGQITSLDNQWAIDGTVMSYTNGRLYFIWSGWTSATEGSNQYLYIAPMDSPTHINGDRVRIHSPDRSWQRSGSSGVNEGPQVLVNNGRTFLVYSAAGSWTQDYCMALMGIDGGKDPLVSSNWWRLDDRPVMWKSNTAYGPGHGSFTQDRNGVPYVVYHANADPNSGWNGRTIRAETFGWNPDSSPAFPRPAGFDREYRMPA